MRKESIAYGKKRDDGAFMNRMNKDIEKRADYILQVSEGKRAKEEARIRDMFRPKLVSSDYYKRAKSRTDRDKKRFSPSRDSQNEGTPVQTSALY
jgi:hypothetical protein